jgi:hypothetical protein
MKRTIVNTVTSAALAGAAILSQNALAQDVDTDPDLDPQVRSFLMQIDKDSSPF